VIRIPIPRLTVVLIAALGIIMLAGQVLAAAGPWQGSDVFRARLITTTDSVADSRVLSAGLEVELAGGWKIYWRSPGDAGLPPELDFSASPAITSHQLDFPAPYRFTILGLESYGYKDRVIFPLRLDLARAGRAVTAAAFFTGLVCDDVCIPVEETLTFNLPARTATGDDVSAEARDIAKFASMVPRLSTSGGVAVNEVAVDGDQLKISFIKAGRPISFPSGDVFIEGPTGYSFARPRISPDYISLAISGENPKELSGRNLTVTAVTGQWLLEQPVTVATAGQTLAGSIATGLMTMIAIAFLGGAVLNVMPCVLPVISLKLGQVIGMGGSSSGTIRLSFLATAAGIVASFLLLGGALFALREAGVAIGWGIQFQNLYFLGFAAAAISLFGLVMLDVIPIPVPQGLTVVGRGMGGYAGDFLAGFMATLLATPCSAPFVGTALTFALTAPPDILLAMFFAMGLGLASPWVMVALWPAFASRLPRPGPWLLYLKRILSAGLFGTALWLVSIMVAVSGDAAGSDDRWSVWAEGRAEEHVAEGNVVFVDVTAAWCLTCKANKALVLDTDEMMAAFEDGKVKLLRADWTKPNPEISAFLASYGRFGIPFNLVYGPNAPGGVVLPELLTITAVKDALSSASP
jgi:suppressor for copper-sensitivity B